MPLCNFYQGLSRLALILVMLISASLAVANPVATANAEAQLISEVSAVQPGRPFWVALRLQMREGWHTYWRNPGDSGWPPPLPGRCRRDSRWVKSSGHIPNAFRQDPC